MPAEVSGMSACRPLSLCLLPLLLAACEPAPLADKPVNMEPSQPAERKYATVCASCHGNRAQGQGVFPRLAGKPEAELRAKLKQYQAGQPVGPASDTMIPFGMALLDSEIDGISRYLAALR